MFLKTLHLSVVILTLTISQLVFAQVAAPQHIRDKTIFSLIFSDKSSSDQMIDLGQYRGKVLLIVNFSTHCGTTSQLKPLEELYQRYRNRGFEVLAFHSEDFGDGRSHLEAGSDRQNHPAKADNVKIFCAKKYGVTFPVFSDISVKGAQVHPVFKFLTNSCKEKDRGEIGFNFEKFLVSKQGYVANRFGPFTAPLSGKLSRAIELELTKNTQNETY